MCVLCGVARSRLRLPAKIAWRVQQEWKPMANLYKIAGNFRKRLLKFRAKRRNVLETRHISNRGCGESNIWCKQLANDWWTLCSKTYWHVQNFRTPKFVGMPKTYSMRPKRQFYWTLTWTCDAQSCFTQLHWFFAGTHGDTLLMFQAKSFKYWLLSLNRQYIHSKHGPHIPEQTQGSAKD